MLQIGEAHPDINVQFEYINELAKIFIFNRRTRGFSGYKEKIGYWKFQKEWQGIPKK